MAEERGARWWAGTAILTVGGLAFFASGIAAFFGNEPTWDPLPSGGASWALWGASIVLILVGSGLRGERWWEG